MGLGVASRAFFAALFNRQTAAEIDRVLSGKPALPAPDDSAGPGSSDASRSQDAERPKAAPKPARDSAVTLLATLQREARLVDLIQEDLAQFSDAQVGAAARPCLQQCSSVLDRLLGLQPLVEGGEGESIDVGENASPMRYQWIGEGTATTGKLVHHGWKATKVDLPKWSGDRADAEVVAAAQVQAG